MSVRLRALLVASFAVLGLALGLGTASAEEPGGEGPSGQGTPVSDVLDFVNDVTGPLVPPAVNDLIGGLYY